MKTIAIITPSDRDFRMHVLQKNVTEQDTEFVHVNSLNSAYGVKANDYVSITNSAKMHNLNEIVETVQKRLIV